MAKDKVSSSETPDLDFSSVSVSRGGRTVEYEWPSAAARAAGVVACSEGHPNIPDPTTGQISCGCGSSEVSKE